jgi:hypothetical protein
MERRKAKSVRATSFPEEADPSNAKLALQEGDECGVGYFARDHAEALSLLADLFDPPEGTARQLEFVPRGRRRPKPNEASSCDEDSDWEGNLDQVKAAIETGSLTLIGSYLRDAADVYGRVGDALDPPPNSRGWRLEFVRKGRGRRTDPARRMMTHIAISADVARISLKGAKRKKQVIGQVQDKRGISRSTIYRAKKWASGSKKSQKKR